MRRWQGTQGRILGELEEVGDGYEFVDEDVREGGLVSDEGTSGWVNAEGEHLADYGVDEEAESDGVVEDGESDGLEGVDPHLEDDEVPLAELIRRRKVLTRDGEAA